MESSAVTISEINLTPRADFRSREREKKPTQNKLSHGLGFFIHNGWAFGWTSNRAALLFSCKPTGLTARTYEYYYFIIGPPTTWEKKIGMRCPRSPLIIFNVFVTHARAR
jgi:hypothetical protein